MKFCGPVSLLFLQVVTVERVVIFGQQRGKSRLMGLDIPGGMGTESHGLHTLQTL